MQQNRILTTLVQRYPDLRGQLTRVDFVRGDLFGRPGEPIRHAVFPVSGMISIVVDLASGDAVEAAMVGSSGVIGAGAAFGATEHVNSSFCQLPGTAYLLPVADLLDIAQRDEGIRAILFAHEQLMMVQAQQTAACNAKHHIMQRLSTWLLRAKDATGASEMVLTQEFLAQILGVQRASVSGFAGRLQDMDVIRYRRGRLSITDEEGLKRQACECHRRLAAFQNKLLRDDGAPLRDAG